jgi:hypothetical protein
MALQVTDVLAIARAGTNYRITGADIINLVKDSVGTSEIEVADITARDALTGITLGDRVRVLNATGDATVASGWAIYGWTGTVWYKQAEQEGLDVVSAVTNLGYTAGAGSGIVTSSTGASATLPAATGTNAGLLLPGGFSKLGFLTVTAATDLDAMRTASHAAATVSGSSATNPIALSGQALSFNIAGLTLAP